MFEVIIDQVSPLLGKKKQRNKTKKQQPKARKAWQDMLVGIANLSLIYEYYDGQKQYSSLKITYTHNVNNNKIRLMA